MFFIERVWTNVEVFIPFSYKATSKGEDSSHGHRGSGQKSGCVVLHYLKLAWEAIFVCVGNLVLETTHASSVVHDEAVIIGSWYAGNWVANSIIKVVSGDFSAAVFALAKIVGPEVDGNIRGEPCDSWVGEGQNIARGFDFVFIAGEEVDAWAGPFVCTTLAVPTFISRCDDGLGVDGSENASEGKSGLHYFNYNHLLI